MGQGVHIRGWVLVLGLWTAPAMGAVAGRVPVSPPGLSVGDVLQVIFGLLLVLAMIIATAWGLRRLGAGRSGPGGLMRVVSALGLGAREKVVVVEVEGQWLVLGVTPGRINLLHSLPRPEGVAAPALPAGGNSFVEMLMKNAKIRR